MAIWLVRAEVYTVQLTTFAEGYRKVWTTAEKHGLHIRFQVDISDLDKDARQAVHKSKQSLTSFLICEHAMHNML